MAKYSLTNFPYTNLKIISNWLWKESQNIYCVEIAGHLKCYRLATVTNMQDVLFILTSESRHRVKWRGKMIKGGGHSGIREYKRNQ